MSLRNLVLFIVLFAARIMAQPARQNPEPARNGVDRETRALGNPRDWKAEQSFGGRQLRLFIPALVGIKGLLRIDFVGINGKALGRFSLRLGGNGWLDIALPQFQPGFYLVRVKKEGAWGVKQVLLR